MIDYNKTKSNPLRSISTKAATLKQAHTKKIKKLTKQNREFLKLIGLLK